MIRVSQGVVKKYTDADAVAACDASNEFIERDVENVMTGTTTLKRLHSGTILAMKTELASFMVISTGMTVTGKSTTHTYNGMLALLGFPSFEAEGTDASHTIGKISVVKINNSNSSYMGISVANTTGGAVNPFNVYHDKIDVMNHPIKDQKNYAHSALSGVKRVVEIRIGGTPYYFEVYPIKA